MFIHSRSSLENHTRLQTKMDKVYSRFSDQKGPKTWSGTYLYDFHKGVPPRANQI